MEVGIFRVNWGLSDGSQHFLKNYIQFRAAILQTIALSPEFHKLYTWWCLFQRLLFFVCVCTCSLNFSSFSNCSLWFFSSCSISFWCFIASYRHIRDRNVTVEWLCGIQLSAGPSTVSQTDAGWKTWSSSLFKARPLEASISYSSCRCNVGGNKQRAAFLSSSSHQTEAKFILLHSIPAFAKISMKERNC